MSCLLEVRNNQYSIVVSLSILGKYGVCYRLDLQLMTTTDF